MGLGDKAKSLFGRKRRCKKLITYQNRTLDFGAKGGAFELSHFKTSEQKLQEASDLAMATDDYLFRLCELYAHIKENTYEFVTYTQKREEALRVLSGLETTLIVFRQDPEGQKEHLDVAVKKMQDFFYRIQDTSH